MRLIRSIVYVSWSKFWIFLASGTTLDVECFGFESSFLESAGSTFLWDEHTKNLLLYRWIICFYRSCINDVPFPWWYFQNGFDFLYLSALHVFVWVCNCLLLFVLFWLRKSLETLIFSMSEKNTAFVVFFLKNFVSFTMYSVVCVGSMHGADKFPSWFRH